MSSYMDDRTTRTVSWTKLLLAIILMIELAIGPVFPGGRTIASARALHTQSPQATTGVCSGSVSEEPEEPGETDTQLYLPFLTRQADDEQTAQFVTHSSIADSHIGLRVAFIHGGDAGSESTSTVAYRALLLDAGVAPYLLPGGNVIGSDFTDCDMILLGADSGAWKNADKRAAVLDSSLPLLALGAGGVNFLAQSGQLDGWQQGSDDTQSVQSTQQGVDAYTFPTAFDLPADKNLTLYNSPTTTQWLSHASPPANSVKIGKVPGSDHDTVVQLDERYSFWGYSAGPETMTPDGKNLFINQLVYRSQSLQIPLQTRRFVPPLGIEGAFLDALTATTLPNLHAYVQLDENATNPACMDPANLQNAGVTIGTYLWGQTYIATIAVNFDPQAALIVDCIRWIGQIPPADKMSDRPIDDVGRYRVLMVFDITPVETEQTLGNYATDLTNLGAQVWSAEIAAGQMAGLLQEDRVRWVEVETPPQPTNDDARQILHVDEVQAATISSAAIDYAGLDGSGITIGVYDNGFDSDHPDFDGRVLRAPNRVREHGTLVAGVLGGSGTNSESEGGLPYQWRGMAPGVDFVLDRIDNLTAERADEAINTYQMRVSNFSLSLTGCEARYNTSAQAMDSWIRGDMVNGTTTIPPHTFVTSAGNEGSTGQYCDDDGIGFHSLSSSGKNMLVVGGVLNNGSDIIFQTSSRGPTFDGRLKPDVMGVNQVHTTVPGGGYATRSGTSIASPSVAGVAALTMQQYKLTTGSIDPLPSSMRGLLIQHAVDLVNEPGTPGYDPQDHWTDPDTGESLVYYQGPDYSTGYGLVHAPRTVDGAAHKNIIEGQLANAGDVDEYTIDVLPSRNELRFTLVWDDYPADPTLADSANHLVSDLDLVLVDPNGGLHYPWVLDPLPANGNFTMDDVGPAYRGEDNRNNVEQVTLWVDEIDPDDWSGDWTVRVTADSLPQGPQSYSLVGEWREIGLPNIYPIDAGYNQDPDSILIPVRVENPHIDVPTAADRPNPDDWRVQIGHSGDWTDATVQTAWGPVGDQVFLVVQPPNTLDPGTYHLVVWLRDEYQRHQHHSTSSHDLSVALREDAIILGNSPTPPVDEMIVVDNSGSMYEDQKLDSAQNAARAFVDLRGAGDQIGVVSFADSDSTPYGLTLIAPDETQLDTAKGHIDNMTAQGDTAMGVGMLAAKDELDTNGTDGHTRHMVLLGDGQENVPPCWNTTSGSNFCQDEDSVQADFTTDSGCPEIEIDTVVIGPEDASWADALAEIADGTCGKLFNAIATPAGGAAAASIGAGPEPYFPRTLQNSLSDIYQIISNGNVHQRRFWVEGDTYQSDSFNESREIDLPDGLHEVTFAVNWSYAELGVRVRLFRPSGVEVADTDADAHVKRDETHVFFRMDNPTSGTWTVTYGGGGDIFSRQEILLTVAAPTDVQMLLELGLPPAERVPGATLPIHAVVVDQTGMITGATVSMVVRAPGGILTTLAAHDDGKEGDHAPADGVYTANYPIAQGGIHQVKAMAAGTANDGVAFTRYATRHFLAIYRPKVLYLYDTDSGKADEFAALLEENGLDVDTLALAGNSDVDLKPYDLIIVGPDTGAANGTWNGGKPWEDTLQETSLPILGIGDGGYALFGKLGLDTGYANGDTDSGTSVIPIETAHPVWNAPYDMEDAAPVQLYTADSPGVTVQGNGIDVTWLGAKPPNSTPLWITLEQNRYLLWGFRRGPNVMTDAGHSLFVNAAWYLISGGN